MIQTIKVFDDRKVSPSRLIVGNQFENGIERIQFELPENMLEKGYRYLILNKPSEDESYPIPLDENNIFYVDSRLTYYLKGVWIANVVLVKDEIKEDNLNPDTWTFISDNITLIVKSNYINNKYLEELPLPENLKIVYDDLLKMYDTIKSDYENGNFNGQDGKSAYELAVENGFKGTEQEWLESLRYDHSDEFKQLADQVKLDAKNAADSATKAESAMNEANTIAQANVKAINKASTDAQNAITISKDSAVNAIGDKQIEAVQAVDTAKTSATQAITEQKESALTEITQEKTSATEAIETGKTNALTEIETAKDEAIEEIENTGVPLEDIEKLAIKETTQGNPTIISDSADWRLQSLNVYGQSEQDSTTGKNLLNPTGATKVGWNIELPNFRLEVGKQYTYTAPILKGSKTCGLYVKASDTQLATYIKSRETQTFTVPEEADLSQGILLAGGSEDTLTLGDELTAMVELGSVATEFEPYTGGKPSQSPDYPQEIKNEEISKISVCNGNLISLIIDAYSSSEGIYLYQNLGFTLQKGIKYVLSVKEVVTALYAIPFGSTSPDNSPFKEYNSDTVEFTPTETGKYYFHAYNQNGITDEQKILWLNVGEKKPYTEHVSEQITLPEPITLRGVPVSSGGNVTIEGNQYIADILKEKDGVIGIERNIELLTMTGANSESWQYNLTIGTIQKEPCFVMSNASKYKSGQLGYCERYIEHSLPITNGQCHMRSAYPGEGRISICDSTFSSLEEWKQHLSENPLKATFLLKEPIFEPLPLEVQEQIRALKSYYPNTVIQSGAFNEVTYVADTKTWIENKLNGVTELALGIGGK